MPPRTILVVSLYAPPSAASAARRPAGLTEYLSRLGHRVIVLTSTFSGSGPVPGAARTVRTRDLLTSGLNWRRANVEALSQPGNAGEVAPPSPIQHYAIPDLQVVSWVPFALPRALAIAREERVDGVITMGPPHSTHLVGAALRARGIAWLAEQQDGWTFEPSSFPGLGATSGVAKWLEREVMTRADAQIGISAPIARSLDERFGRGELVLLAYDPDEMAAADAAAAEGRDPLLDPDRVTLIYTGSIVDHGEAPETLWRAVAELKERRQDAGRLEVLVVGPVRQDTRDRAVELGLQDVVRFEATVDRIRALKLQRQADVLLVLTHQERTSVLTNKLIEYLVTGRPIMVMGEATEAGRFVEERHAGVVVSGTDVEGTVRALERVLDGDLPSREPGAIEDLSYPAIARQVSELFEAAITR